MRLMEIMEPCSVLQIMLIIYIHINITLTKALEDIVPVALTVVRSCSVDSDIVIM